MEARPGSGLAGPVRDGAGLPRSAVVRGAVEAAAVRHAGQAKKDGSSLLDHVLEVGRAVSSAGLDDEVVAAAVLHDLRERTDTDAHEVEERFGPRVAGLVDALTENEAIRDIEARKGDLRRKVAGAGPDAGAIFAADKLSNLRRKRARWLDGGGDRDALAHDVRMWQLDAAELGSVDPDLPLLSELRDEVRKLAGELDAPG